MDLVTRLQMSTQPSEAFQHVKDTMGTLFADIWDEGLRAATEAAPGTTPVNPYRQEN